MKFAGDGRMRWTKGRDERADTRYDLSEETTRTVRSTNSLSESAWVPASIDGRDRGQGWRKDRT